MKELEERLREAKDKDRQQTTMQKEQSLHKTKIRALEQEIEKMKHQKVSLVKKIKEESEQHRKWKQERVLELVRAKQANVKKDREIQKLKEESKRKGELARRKQEELSALMKRNKNEKQKMVNAKKDRMARKNIDVQSLQEWILVNTDKMLKYKELQHALQ